MQPLNNDMDDLMRKAAADYPVLPHGADWQKIAQQLEPAGKEEKASYGVLKKLGLMLVFLLAFFFCNRFFTYEYGGLKKVQSVGQKEADTDISNDPAATGHGKRTQPSPVITRKLTLPAGAQQVNAPSSANIRKELAFRKTRLQETMAVSKTNKAVAAFKTSRLLLSGTAFWFDARASISTAVAEKMRRISITEKVATKKNMAAPARFEKTYVSFLAGPDLSRVKRQKAAMAGYSIGFLGGINLSTKWAVEAGLMWDRKNYYSKGVYFKTDKIYLPQHSEISQVDGYCAMFEIPLNLRYNIVRKQNLLFASAGVSSYLMQKEDYNYVYQRYGVNYTGNAKYKSASKNWFAMANVSIGYEHRLVKALRIRIEPYMKVPLAGVGVGSLPLNSAGVLVGITHPIH